MAPYKCILLLLLLLLLCVQSKRVYAYTLFGSMSNMLHGTYKVNCLFLFFSKLYAL